MRIDDLDRDRCIPGLAAQFQSTLEVFGFEWDGPVALQSERADIYGDALSALISAGRCYACRCTRSVVAAAQLVEPGSEPVYPGTCRADPAAARGPHALRLRVDGMQAEVSFEDAFQGTICQDCQRDAGDFVVRRRDGFVAYHLAVVVDDELQGVTEVVRGADLLSSTPRQILLQRALGYCTPRYGHLPLLTEPDGLKLAKSRRSVALEPRDAPCQLWQALHWLNQAPPLELMGAPVREIWAWALPNWHPERFRGVRERRLEEQPAV